MFTNVFCGGEGRGCERLHFSLLASEAIDFVFRLESNFEKGVAKKDRIKVP